MSLLVRAWVPTRTLSSTERLANSATFWNVRPMPISAIRCGGRVRMLCALHQDVARARLIEPAEAIEQRGLAGAVRPDQAEDLALLHVERHAIQRDDAAEHDADVANREQGSGRIRWPCASCACIISRSPAVALGRSWPRQLACRPQQCRLSDPLDHTRNFPSCFYLFVFLLFLIVAPRPPSAASMFLTIVTRRGPMSLSKRSSVKRNAGAPQLKA